MKTLFLKPLWCSGIVLILLGLFHLPLPLIDQSAWEGSVSWRKPILFGVSTGMTLCALGWLADHIGGRLKRADLTVAWLIAVSLVLEVVLITMQRWRGVASHFNRATAFDAGVDVAMLVLICAAFAGIVWFFVRSFGQVELESDYLFALRAGMLFLVISCVIGFVISWYGYRQMAASLSPEVVGSGGVTKFPHGIAIHALQILPAIVWLMRWLQLQLRDRRFVIICLTVSFGFQILFACCQTFGGFARFQIANASGAALASLSLLPILASIVLIVRRLIKRI